jgi:chemotaxis protein MotB
MIKPMEQLEQQLALEEEGSHNSTGASRWLVPYADMLTVLLGLLFVLLAYQLQHSATLQGKLKQTEHHLAQARHALKQQQYSKPQQALASSNPKQVQALKKQLEQVKQRLLTLQKTLSIVSPSLSQGVKKGMVLPTQVSVQQEPRGLVLSIADGLLFEPGSARLSPVAYKALAAIAPVLQLSKAPIRIEGHTDSSPIATAEYPSNWELSTHRATTILKALVAQHGVAPQQLSAAGYGSFKPLSKNYSEQGKQKNRRVDIVILQGVWAALEPTAPVTRLTE